MARQSPVRGVIDRAEPLMAAYGPGADAQGAVDVVQTFGAVEAEYAAVRKACGLMDMPTRGTLEVTGSERLAFLNRMLTQELKGFAPMSVRRSFWLNKKGRIDGDLRLVQLADRILIDVDIHAAARTCDGLNGYIIAEDVTVADVSDQRHRLALHGPRALEVLGRSAAMAGANANSARLAELKVADAAIVTIAGREVLVDRQDSTGEIGLELLMAAGDAEAVYTTLLQAAHAEVGGRAQGANPRPLLRPIGWHAWNIARIEAGTPAYYLDFGPDSLPAETGVLDDRVSFTKGCYLGQEIVARMKSLGHPKQRLVALRVSDPAISGDAIAADRHEDEAPEARLPRCPETGSAVIAASAAAGDGAAPEPIGAVTSATLSPMLAAQPICFAMVKYANATEGAQLLVAAEGTGAWLPAVVQKDLAFWTRG